MSLNSGSVSRDMANTPSFMENFCCSVPLTTMRLPRSIWLNLPLTQKGRYSTGLGNGACTRRRRSCSWIAIRGSQFVERAGEPGMIHRDHCHRWESWQWRVRWALACPGDVGMSKINGLTRHVALSEEERQLAL
ncbi:hypothetical protein TNCV_1835191 [Trichonephila clavipes]|nr:hypothetical protein TNCV_1835191 [Trichonephila clavipes]